MTAKKREEYVGNCPLIPESLKEYMYQVGGHGIQNNKKYQILNDNNGVLFKPVQNFPKGETEIKFYQTIFSDKCVDKDALELRKFIPKYIGIFGCRDPLKENLYIGIEDLLYRFKLPSVADVKIGKISYEPNVSPEKMKTEKEKYQWREKVGFLITGIKVHDPETIFLDRYHGRRLNEEQVYTQGIKRFLGPDSSLARSLADKFIFNLQHLLSWFSSQKKMAFIASSVLMAYDNFVSSESKSHDTKETNGYRNPDVIVRLIDFTHVLPATDHDHNCKYAIESLISYFSRVKSDNDY